MQKSFCAVLVLLTLLACMRPKTSGAQQVADLIADGSDSSNPNVAAFGTWSYLEGENLLPHTDNWLLLCCSTPAWAPDKLVYSLVRSKPGIVKCELEACRTNHRAPVPPTTKLILHDD